jgi:hypothetical protein
MTYNIRGRTQDARYLVVCEAARAEDARYLVVCEAALAEDTRYLVVYLRLHVLRTLDI